MIGERIKQIRKEQKISQTKFAAEFGISQAYVSKIEKGTENPSDTLLKFISYKYCISFEWLKTGESKNEEKDLLQLFRGYVYRLEKILNNYSEGEQFDISMSQYCFTSIFENINNSKNRTDYCSKLYSIFRNLWSLFIKLEKCPNDSHLKEQLIDEAIHQINSNLLSIK